MLFNSIHFLYFLPIVFLIYWIIDFKWRWLVLLLASYYFYMSWNPAFGILLFGTTIIDFYTARKISQTENPKKRKRWLMLSILSNLGCLFAFKYFIFFFNSSVFILNSFSQHHYQILDNIIIPIGLSFYTFQSLSYTIDVYRNAIIPERNPARFALYVSFFPQLVAGPVERFSNLMPQLYEKHKLAIEKLTPGVRLLTWGFFKKLVIADRLANFVNPVFADVHAFSGLTLLVAGFFFVVQVYCDFSGYSDIATGVARLFGIELMLNWKRPLLSKSLREFWTRNHISMTTWFRDYLYISLGGNKCSYNRWLSNIFLVFLISGLWHGANWTFVVWGAMHGFVYVMELVLKKPFSRIRSMAFFGWIYLILFHTVSLIAFRANSISDLGIIYSKIFSFHFDPTLAIAELKSLHHLFPLVLAIIFILFLFAKELNEEYGIVNKIRGYEGFVKPVFYVLIFIMIFVFGEFNANEFIYFHF